MSRELPHSLPAVHARAPSPADLFKAGVECPARSIPIAGWAYWKIATSPHGRCRSRKRPSLTRGTSAHVAVGTHPDASGVAVELLRKATGAPARAPRRDAPPSLPWRDPRARTSPPHSRCASRSAPGAARWRSANRRPTRTAWRPAGAGRWAPPGTTRSRLLWTEWRGPRRSRRPRVAGEVPPVRSSRPSVSWPGGAARVRVLSLAPGGGRLGRLHLRDGRLPSEREGPSRRGSPRRPGSDRGSAGTHRQWTPPGDHDLGRGPLTRARLRHPAGWPHPTVTPEKAESTSPGSRWVTTAGRPRRPASTRLSLGGPVPCA